MIIIIKTVLGGIVAAV